MKGEWILKEVYFEDGWPSVIRDPVRPVQEPVTGNILKDAYNAMVEKKTRSQIQDGQRALPLYATPPQRKWVGLTDEELEAMAEKFVTNFYFDTLKYARAIEAKLKEKNT